MKISEGMKEGSKRSIETGTVVVVTAAGMTVKGTKFIKKEPLMKRVRKR